MTPAATHHIALIEAALAAQNVIPRAELDLLFDQLHMTTQQRERDLFSGEEGK